MEMIAKDFKHGENLELGHNIIIEPDVIVGDNVSIGHKCVLRSGTRIGNNTELYGCVETSGVVYIGNNVLVGHYAGISRGTIIEDCVFYGPGSWTLHRVHVNHFRPKVPEQDFYTVLGYGAIIGAQCVLMPGVKVVPQTVIATGSFIVTDCDSEGIYMGNPAQRVKDLPDMYIMEDVPDNAGSMYCTDEILGHIKEYMPHIQFK